MCGHRAEPVQNESGHLPLGQQSELGTDPEKAGFPPGAILRSTNTGTRRGDPIGK